RAVRPRDALQLRVAAPSAAPGLRVSGARRAGRPRGGDPAGVERGRGRARRHPHRDAVAGRVRRDRRRTPHPRLPIDEPVMSAPAFSRVAAITGIGQTELSRHAGRSELQLACESITAALNDAGLQPADVDGLVSYTVDPVEETELVRSVGFEEIGYS